MKKNKIIVTVVLFVIFGSLIAGWTIAAHLNIHEKAIILVKNSGYLNNIIMILINNMVVVFVIIISGFTLFLLPFSFMTLNFLIIGSSIYTTFQKNGATKTFLIYLHGLFEIPAVGIAFYLSIIISLGLLTKIGNSKYLLKDEKKIFFSLIPIILILLIIGAVIESYSINYFNY